MSQTPMEARRPDADPATLRAMALAATPKKCPTCDSPSPELHPAVQHEGEVSICRNPWHSHEAGRRE